MGIHESQSLFFEMQLSRSTAFMAWLAPEIQNFIRVDADEVTYPAHVILRYEIERDLIAAKDGAVLRLRYDR